MNSASNAPSRRWTAGPGWLALTVLICMHFCLCWAWHDPTYLHMRLYVHGQERLPFQGRILMAWTLRPFADNAHLSAAVAHLSHLLPENLRRPFVLPELVINFAMLLIIVFAGRAIIRTMTGNAVFAAWASLLFVYMAYFDLILPLNAFQLPYDLPSLACFVLATWLIVSERYLLLLPLIAVATLNRETSIFIPLFLAVYTWFQDREPRIHAGTHKRSKLLRAAPFIVLQVLIWLAIKLWLRHHLAYDTGNGVEFHVPGNLRSLIKPQQWPEFLCTFGFLLPLFIHDFSLIGDRAFARATVVTMLLWGAAMMVAGTIIEIRIFSELSAFVAPCIASILYNRFQPAGSERHNGAGTRQHASVA